MKCIICNKENYKILVKKSDMRWNCWNYNKKIVECKNCGLIWLQPQWAKKELAELYKDFSTHQDFSGQIQAKRITKYLNKYINYKDRILEIGAGKGDNLKRLEKQGYNIIGIDKDASVCDNKLIFNKDIFESPKLFPFKFDFIYSIQVFEHINNPKNFLILINKLLKEKGRFLFELPNINDPLITLYNIPEFKKFYYIPYHLFFYNDKTLKKLFNKYNINVEIKLLQKYGIINHLRWLIFKKPGNWHPHIPILDNIYKWILVNIFKKSDTLIAIGG